MSGLSELVSRERDKERRSAWLAPAIALTNDVKKWKWLIWYFCNTCTGDPWPLMLGSWDWDCLKILYATVFKTNVDVFLHRDTVVLSISWTLSQTNCCPRKNLKRSRMHSHLMSAGWRCSTVVLMVTSSHARGEHSLSPIVFLQRRFSVGIVKMMMKITTHLNALNESKEFY